MKDYEIIKFIILIYSNSLKYVCIYCDYNFIPQNNGRVTFFYGLFSRFTQSKKCALLMRIFWVNESDMYSNFLKPYVEVKTYYHAL